MHATKRHFTFYFDAMQVRAAHASDADFDLDDASAQELAAMTAAMLERARVKALALYVCQRMGFVLEDQVPHVVSLGNHLE